MAFAFSLVDVNGTSRALDDTLGIEVKLGARGLAFPVITPVMDKLPYAPGVNLRRLGTAAGILELPLRLKANTSALLDTLYDDLRGWVFPGTERDEPRLIRLRVTRDDGAQREIEGLAVLGPGDDSQGFPMWQKTTLTMFCPDPYWRDQSDTVVSFASGEGVSSWWPYWPYHLTPSAMFATKTITLGGHVEAWPVIVITGPGTDPVLTNLTTGEALTFEGLTLVGGDVLTVDTSERGDTAKTIRDQNDANFWPYATPTSVMWPLETGDNEIRVQLANTTGASAVSLTYRRRWAGGHR